MKNNTNIINSAKKFFSQFETFSQLDNYLWKLFENDANVCDYRYKSKYGRTSQYFWVGKLLIKATSCYESEQIDNYTVYNFA